MDNNEKKTPLPESNVFTEPRGKLNCYDWLGDIPGEKNTFDMVEVQFKNTRKGYYKNSMNLPLKIGDMVAVEANPGHDIGRVSLTGKLVALQMKKANLRPDAEIRRIFRKAKASDLEKFEAAKAREYSTMIRSRQIAKDLKLDMKIGDVEYQGDGNKAIFYYIADERVDFRQLIKVLAEVFRVRIEMKQIGARQEAGRIGGIGPCGRPLCCSSWMTNFVSVATSAARYQDISLNPQKLAGQCAKLKCCLNYEVDAYVESVKSLPSREIRLETKTNTYFHFKTDVFNRIISYSTDKNIPANLVTITAERAFEVIALNKRGIRPDNLEDSSENGGQRQSDFGDIVGQDSVTRFDKAKKKRKKGNGQNKNGNAPQANGNDAPAAEAPESANQQERNGKQRRRNKGNQQPQGNAAQENNAGQGNPQPQPGNGKGNQGKGNPESGRRGGNGNQEQRNKPEGQQQERRNNRPPRRNPENKNGQARKNDNKENNQQAPQPEGQ